MHRLFHDFETASLYDLRVVGLDRYARDPSTRILMLAWALDDDPVQLWVAGEGHEIPAELLAALRDPSVQKVAWHAAFERNIWLHKQGIDIPAGEWRDPMIMAHYLSLPGKLAEVCRILADKLTFHKMDAGTKLIDLFSLPVKAPKNGTGFMFGTDVPWFRDGSTNPQDWAQFKEYCKMDVESERELFKLFLPCMPPDSEWRAYALDRRMNERGLPISQPMVKQAIILAERYSTEVAAELQARTGLANPNSDKQMLHWVRERGYPYQSLLAKYVKAAMDAADSKLTPECREVLKLRKAFRKASYKKLYRFRDTVNADGRLCNQFNFYGAPRTGRWSGSDVQIHNLPRPIKAVKSDPETVIRLIVAGDYDGIARKYVSVSGAISSALRMLIQAEPRKKLVVADLSAIENRGLGYLARCDAILDVFRQGRDPYLDFATKLYPISYEDAYAEYKAGNSEKRQNSKPAVLGCGYGLGGGSLYENEFGDMVRGGLWGYALAVCGVDMPQELAQRSVDVFRAAYAEVKQFWYDCESAFKQVFWVGRPMTVGYVRFERLTIPKFGRVMRIVLPSGRALYYLNVQIHEEVTPGRDGKPWRHEVITYDGIEHSATQGEDGAVQRKRMAWGRVRTWGGKLVENIVQAFCRDLLLNGMFEAEGIGFDLIGTFHDELLADAPDVFPGLSVTDLCDAMCVAPAWAPDIPLGAAGYESQFYKKD